ncbi:hypothetical protein [Litoribacillus peritrichatus]|uniref:Uncharacterized protein n=1 Tax=Litoribacillus peritrichatus TaxID=718191 RepID=A0ABP7MWI4_9GAMM
MQVFELKNAEGEVTAFEISNSFMGSGSIARFIKRCEGCDVTSVRKLFQSDDVHVHFIFEDQAFTVSEPHGESSRLVIAPVEITEDAMAVIHWLMKSVAATPFFKFY